MKKNAPLLLFMVLASIWVNSYATNLTDQKRTLESQPIAHRAHSLVQFLTNLTPSQRFARAKRFLLQQHVPENFPVKKDAMLAFLTQAEKETASAPSFFVNQKNIPTPLLRITLMLIALLEKCINRSEQEKIQLYEYLNPNDPQNGKVLHEINEAVLHNRKKQIVDELTQRQTASTQAQIKAVEKSGIRKATRKCKNPCNLM